MRWPRGGYASGTKKPSEMKPPPALLRVRVKPEAVSPEPTRRLAIKPHYHKFKLPHNEGIYGHNHEVDPDLVEDRCYICGVTYGCLWDRSQQDSIDTARGFTEEERCPDMKPDGKDQCRFKEGHLGPHDGEWSSWASAKPAVPLLRKKVWTMDAPGRHIFYHGLGTKDYICQVWGQDEKGRGVIYGAVETSDESQVIVNVPADLVTFPVKLVVCW